MKVESPEKGCIIKDGKWLDRNQTPYENLPNYQLPKEPPPRTASSKIDAPEPRK